MRLRWPVAVALLATLVIAGGCNRGRQHFNEGQRQMKRGRYAEAVVAFERAVTENAGFGEAHYNLGAARFELAAARLRALIVKRGPESLRQALPPPGLAPGAPRPVVDAAALRRDLGTLSAEEIGPVLRLVRESVAAKNQALRLFRAGKFLVVEDAAEQRRMLAQLESAVSLWEVVIRESARDRPRALLALLWPHVLRDLLLWPVPGKNGPNGADAQP